MQPQDKELKPRVIARRKWAKPITQRIEYLQEERDSWPKDCRMHRREINRKIMKLARLRNGRMDIDRQIQMDLIEVEYLF